MFGSKWGVGRVSRDEGERPFWISYADLMTALMMLFLVVMAVSLFAVTSRNDRHEAEVNECMAEFRARAAGFANVVVDTKNRRVNFGERARFAHRDYDLSGADARTLREFAPVVLDFADSPCGRRLLKRIVVEGYTSQVGSYLFNLDLSLKRAQSVLCALMDDPFPGERRLSDAQKRRMRDLFMVGGYSFNASRATDEESRRVEFKLEFWSVDKDSDEAMSAGSFTFDAPLGQCQLVRHAVTR